jgi:GT2 family glycosyltransferase
MVMSALPSVTIIVLNYNGLHHLQTCFASLAEVDYPTEQLELMLVDNASTDGSVAFVQSHYPQVNIVQNETNLGFAPANNRGAREARGQYVVFLNNDMVVEPEFLRGLIEAIASMPGAVCAGAKILNWDGTQFDFGGAASHFAGYAYQIGLGKPYSDSQFTESGPILYACGGAMLIERHVFLDVGGFDEDYFIYYEDLDLGWRLWILGYDVVFAPRAVARHRHHGTMDGFSNYRKRVLYKRNALSSALKNYADENMGRVMAAVLLGTVSGVVEQAVQHGTLRLDEFHIQARSRSEPHIALGRYEMASLVAIHDVVERLPQLLEKRRRIQAARKRTDEAVALRFAWPFRYWPDVSAHTQYQVATALDVQSIFCSVPRRVLVISSDILPYPGLPTVGSGLRAWGLGQGLTCRGHEVVFSMPRAALTGREHLVSGAIADLAWEHHTLLSIVRRVDPEVIVVCNWPILDMLPSEGLTVPVILDQHGPHLLERHYQKFGDTQDNVRGKLNALRKADFFTCAGNRQLEYFKGWLARAGWSEAEIRDQAAAIPVSLSPELPEHHPAEEVTLVYGGVFLPWQDPSAVLTAVVEELERRRTGRLFFFGGKHPVYPVDTGIFQTILDKLQQSDRVTAPGMVAHDALLACYASAHVAVDVMQRNSERELAFTTRTVEYLWCGVPVLYHDYAELSDYIREYEAGWLVNPEDADAVRHTLRHIFDHPEEVAARSRNAQRLVRERLTWDNTITPLDSFVRLPRMRWHPPRAQSAVAHGMDEARYLLGVAWNLLRQKGPATLWREGWTYLRRRFATG